MDKIFELNTTMKEVETKFPFARSTLHSHFHIGGCASCGYEPTETIAQVGERYHKDPHLVADILNHAYSDMHTSEISVHDFAKLFSSCAQTVLVLDVREEWEYQVAHIPGSILLLEANFKDVLTQAKECAHVVVVCHHGLRSMNATLYLRDNGIRHAKNLTGGIDAYSLNCDPTLQRY